MIAAPEGFRRRAMVMLAGMSPANFAMVMSTGIVSVALELLGYQTPARFLFRLNILLYVLLWMLYLLRPVLSPGAFRADLSDHARGPGYLTSIAATCILGTQFVLFDLAFAVALGLLGLGLLLWMVILPGLFVTLAVGSEKPELAQGINGTWLVAVVGTQAVATLTCTLSGQAPSPGVMSQEVAFLFSLCLFCVGGMLYMLLMPLIVYRLLFSPVVPADLQPSYWINAGAAAISTLAGALLAARAGESHLLSSVLPFVKGATVFFWATASIWIPLLFILGFWRHFIRRHPFEYSPHYWGLVFPMGMYTACTVRLSQTLGLDFLMAVPRGFLFAAVTAWLLTFAGMIRCVGSLLMRARREK